MLDDHQVPATRADMKALVAEYRKRMIAERSQPIDRPGCE